MSKSNLVKIALIVLVLLALLTGGETILFLLEEGGDLVLELTQAVLIRLYESLFGLDYLDAQNKAAWTSLFLLVVALFVIAVKLAPVIRRKVAHASVQVAGALNWWRTATLFKKFLAISGGLAALTLLIFFLGMVI